MASRRMFSKTITNSSRFLMMPPTSQLLYIHLSMNADDDGFVEHFPVMRMVEAKPDDLKVLSSKGFVKIFDDQVLVVTEWKENNYLRSDRYSPSKYLQIYKKEMKGLATGIPKVDQVDTQVRLGKDRIELGKDKKNNLKVIPQASLNKMDLINYLKEQLNIKTLDGSDKWNKVYAGHLLKKMNDDPNRVKKYIDYALLDPFHKQNSTSFKYLYNNLNKIALKAKSQQESHIKI